MSSTLQPLESVTRISDTVVRILGQNPGKFTLQGTNTYLIGHSPYTLLDTGEGKAAYLPLLAAQLGGSGTIGHIVISHQHKDHWGGLTGVLGLLRDRGAPRPKIHKWRNLVHDQDIIGALPADSFLKAEGGDALHALADGQTLQATGCTLTVISTPGHTDDSVCLALDDGSIFTADTVLGQSTAVFTNLSTYLASLRRLASLDPPTLYPGHGPIVAGGTAAIEQYISHRQQREDQILAVLARPLPLTTARMPGEWADEAAPTAHASAKGWSTAAIVQEIYSDVGFTLQNAAGRGVDLHLQKLLEEGKVEHAPSGEIEWRLRAG